MGFVFISYSSTDRRYVDLLVGEFSRRQLEFWYDRRIDSGDRWTQALEAKVRECTVFVPVVTPDSVASEWCERELHLADRLGKPMAPLLLDGVVPITLITRQYDDVTDGVLPSGRWFESVVAVLATESGEPAASTDNSVRPRRSPVEPKTGTPHTTTRVGAGHPAGTEPYSDPAPAPAQAQPWPGAAASRRAAVVDAVQHPSTLVSLTVVGFALIYLLVLSPELGLRSLSVAAAVLGTVASVSSFGLHYTRGVKRQRRVDDERLRRGIDTGHAT